MKYLFPLIMILSGCCATISADYVEADAAAWKHIDPYLDGWIDNEPLLKAREKKALHAVNAGRRARILHAQEEIDAESSSE